MRSYNHDVRNLFPALEIIDDFVAQWQRSFSNLACRKGCSICCTDRVTVTEAEAARILERYPSEELSLTAGQKQFPTLCTTNEFAISCLHGTDQLPDDFPETLGRCPFLSAAKECSVYPVRPLMCRLFIATVPCEEKGEATISELAFLTQIILQQLAEHLSRGTKWGNLAAMLRYSSNKLGSEAQEGLRNCLPIPFFPFASEDKRKLAPQLTPLFDRLKTGGWLPDNFNLDFESMDFD